MQRCWRMPPFMIFSSHVIRTSPPRLGGEVAGSARAHCTRPIIAASHVAAFVVWDRSMIGVSACAAHDMAAGHARRQPRCAFLAPRSIWRQLSF
jgi:hypothetical protein